MFCLCEQSMTGICIFIILYLLKPKICVQRIQLLNDLNYVKTDICICVCVNIIHVVDLAEVVRRLYQRYFLMEITQHINVCANDTFCGDYEGIKTFLPVTQDKICQVSTKMDLCTSNFQRYKYIIIRKCGHRVVNILLAN